MPRRKLPTRRRSTNIKFQFMDGVKYNCTYSLFEDNTLAEIFINASKAGSSINIMARDLAIVTSLALQWGVPMSLIREAIEQSRDGIPEGPLGRLLAEIGES